MTRLPASTRVLRLALTAAVLTALPAARGEPVAAGRVFDHDRANRLFLTVGQVGTLEGSVDETTRRLFTVTGQDAKQDNAESYSFDELGLDSSDLTFGLSYERLWRWVTLRLDGAYVRAEASGNAPRDLFIGVSDVNFGGGLGESCVDWLVFDVSGPIPLLLDQQSGGAYGSTNDFRYYPDISVDRNNNIAIGYTKSSSSTFTEVWAWIRSIACST